MLEAHLLCMPDRDPILQVLHRLLGLACICCFVSQPQTLSIPSNPQCRFDRTTSGLDGHRGQLGLPLAHLGCKKPCNPLQELLLSIAVAQVKRISDGENVGHAGLVIVVDNLSASAFCLNESCRPATQLANPTFQSACHTSSRQLGDCACRDVKSPTTLPVLGL